MSTSEIPKHYVFYRGQWCHPSRVPKSVTPVPYPPLPRQVEAKPAKRIRQSTKPLMNKLERRCFDFLQRGLEDKRLIAQGVTFKIANGVRFTPDIFCFNWYWRGEYKPVAWEVKGPWFTDDAKVKLKVLASTYPQIVVLLAWEDPEDGMWEVQQVLP